MFYEKWGFMLIFWNMAGVPLSYCHCTIYLANHDPAVYRWHRGALAFMYVSYLVAYWIWDTAGSQKSRFKQMETGGLLHRKAFPQLPWQTVHNPKVIKTDAGGSLLVDGWCMLFYFILILFRSQCSCLGIYIRTLGRVSGSLPFLRHLFYNLCSGIPIYLFIFLYLASKRSMSLQPPPISINVTLQISTYGFSFFLYINPRTCSFPFTSLAFPPYISPSQLTPPLNQMHTRARSTTRATPTSRSCGRS